MSLDSDRLSKHCVYYMHRIFVLSDVEYLEHRKSCRIKSRISDRPACPVLHTLQKKAQSINQSACSVVHCGALNSLHFLQSVASICTVSQLYYMSFISSSAVLHQVALELAFLFSFRVHHMDVLAMAFGAHDQSISIIFFFYL